MPESIKYIKTSRVSSWLNVRTTDADVQELAKSMQDEGQKVPIRVWRSGVGKYTVIAGHRRLAAARSLGWDTIKAEIEPAPQDKAALIIDQLVENMQRKSLSYYDKAEAFFELTATGMNQHAVALRFGLSDAEVSLALAAKYASPKLRAAVDSGKIAPCAIKPLLGLTLEEQEELAPAAIQQKTVRRIAALVKAHHCNKGLKDEKVIIESDALLIQDSVDPLEIMAIESLQQALQLIEVYASTEINSERIKLQSEGILLNIRRLIK